MGAHVLRPWMLAWRADFGLPGSAEPDQIELLAELILSEGSPASSLLVE